MSKAEILVIDDEPQIQKLLEITLQTNQYSVRSATSAREGLAQSSSQPPDLILLDLSLPDDSGHNVLKKLREWYTNPVIILSVKHGEEDIVKALDNGANDYLSKPFRTGELLARIRSALRQATVEDSETLLKIGDLQIDLSTRTVKKKDEVLKLTSTEYNLLTLFARNEGKVLTHQFLLKTIWGPAYVSQTQYLRVFIAQIRKKIETDPNHSEYLFTISGVGYRFCEK